VQSNEQVCTPYVCVCVDQGTIEALLSQNETKKLKKIFGKVCTSLNRLGTFWIKYTFLCVGGCACVCLTVCVWLRVRVCVMWVRVRLMRVCKMCEC
jgi:hypothetical protein